MIEIGRMEALERPLVLLREINAPDLPADLKGLLYAELDADLGKLEHRVREEVSRQEPLHRLNGDRFLSEGLLKRVL